MWSAVRSWSWRCAVVLALGGFGVLLLACSRTSWAERRRERAARCTVCRRHQRWQGAVLAAVAALELVGAGMYLYQDSVADPPSCGVEWFEGGEIPEVAHVKEPSRAWRTTRDLATAPATGLAHTFASARGMDFCTVGEMTVAFPRSSSRKAGTTVGDMFLTPVTSGLSGTGAQALGEHESRHVDQWTVTTIVAGPIALPVLYTLDETFFPGPRNHFERGAGLMSGGYEEKADPGPRPKWNGVIVLLVLALFLGRYRLRLLVDRLHPGYAAASPEPAADRCALHPHLRHHH